MRSLDPRLLPFAPILYVAWADGELKPAEVRLLREHVLDAGLAAAIAGPWLDPDAPPSGEDLLALLSWIRDHAGGLEPGARRSLAELGLGLAERAGHPAGPAERAAVERLAAALDLHEAESVEAVLAAERPLADLPEVRPSFDVSAMAELLDGEQRAMRTRVRALLASGRFEPAIGLSTARYRERVLEWCRLLAGEGLGALSMPSACGGMDDPAGFVAAFETLAMFDLSLLVKFGVQFGLWGGSVQQLGTGKQHERWLEDIGTLALPGCFAMTETGHGSNVDDIETMAVYDPDTREFEIHTPLARARKDYIGNAARDGRMATVFAQLETRGERHGVHAFVVPIRDADGAPLDGVAIEDCGEKLGLNGVDNGRLAFDRVRIPRDHLLDRFASVTEDGEYRSSIASPGKRFFTMLGTLVGGRIAVGSAAVTASGVALAIAIRYGARRRQFGPPGSPERVLLDYPAHRRRLLPRLASTYAFGFAMHALQRRYVDREADPRRLEASAAGLKALATWHASGTIQECREACGGQGYLAENRFAALKADTDVFTTFEGDNTVLLQLVARDLLTGFRREFGDMGAWGLARFLVDRARVAVVERNPVATRRTDEEHLRDPGFQRDLLEARRDELLYSLARRVKARVDRGMDGFDALVECQDHALGAARAHALTEVFEAVHEAEGGVPGSSLAEVLERIRSLFALSTLERDRAWFLEHGYVDARKTKAIRGQVDALCAALRPDAVPLVDAFEIPAPCLAPIAL